MANEAGWSYWSVIPRIKPGSIKGLESQLNGGDFQRVGQSTGDNLGRNIGRSAEKRVGLMSKGIIAPLLTAVAAVKVKDLIGDSLGEARESQKVGALTASIIKSTGGAAKVTAKDVDRLSTAISNKTGVDDEQIASGANLLLTFKNVKREGKGLEDIFGRATTAAADLSAAGFGDITGTAKQLGKALNDPLKGISALGRSGVTFTEQQKLQIAEMVKQNDLLGAQKIILGEVESQVGGAAAATATLGEKSKVAGDNIKEGLGNAILPLVDDMQTAFLEKGVPAAEKFVGWFEDKGVPAIRSFADEAGPLAKSLLPAVGTSLGIIADGAKAIAPAVKSIVDSFNSLPKAAQTAILAGAGAAYLGSKATGALGAVGALGGGGGKKPKSLLGKAGDVAGKAPVLPIVGGAATSPGLIGAALGVGTVAALALEYKAAKDIKNNLAKRPLPAMLGRGGGSDQRSQATKDFQAEQSAKKNLEYQRQAVAQTAENEKRRKAATQAIIDGYDLENAKAGEVGATLDMLGQKQPRPKIEPIGLVESLKNSFDFGAGLDRLDKKNAKPKISTPGLGAAIGGVAGLAGQLSAIDGTYNAKINIAKTGINVGLLLGQLNAIKDKGSSGGGRVRGFDGGGWTGPGQRLDPAGIVHADEFVVKKSSRQSIERQAPGALDHMNRTGELVGASAGSSPAVISGEGLLAGATVVLRVGQREFQLAVEDANFQRRRKR